MFCIGAGRRRIYLPVIGLKEIAAEFGDRRAVPSLAYMLGFFAMGVGGVFMGWLADRTSPRVPLLIAGVSIFAGGWLARSGGELALYVGYAVLLGFFGNAATFTPAMNNVQGWFDRRRSTAVSIISVGPADLRFHLAADLPLAAARYRLAPDPGGLWRGGGPLAVPLRLLCAALTGPARLRRAAPAEDQVGPAAAVARRSWCCCRPPASAAAPRWPCRSCTWWRSAATSAFRRRAARRRSR